MTTVKLPSAQVIARRTRTGSASPASISGSWTAWIPPRAAASAAQARRSTSEETAARSGGAKSSTVWSKCSARSSAAKLRATSSAPSSFVLIIENGSICEKVWIWTP